MWVKSELKIIKIITTNIISVPLDSSIWVIVNEPDSEKHEDIIIVEKRF